MLRYSAKAQVGGKLAQIGSRLIDSTAKKMANEFFTNFSIIFQLVFFWYEQPLPKLLSWGEELFLFWYF